jgi:nitrite reductase/ring-hydroxylating ferredoxin subunit
LIITNMSTMVALLPVPEGLAVPGCDAWPFVAVAGVDDIDPGGMRRLTRGDLDLLLAYTAQGLCLVDDRCPHMSAPLSLGALDDCVVACPLHRGRFDLSSGEVTQFPTTGGLDADGRYHAPWQPEGSAARTDPPDLKAKARALTRIRRIRYYPLRVRDGVIEARLPV